MILLGVYDCSREMTAEAGCEVKFLLREVATVELIRQILNSDGPPLVLNQHIKK